ncbi:MAG: hypothetical protein GY787_04105 [Alteromonadales bacterium]|nr:hypothetical protein [Alteromonadales bacterium]
MESSRKSILLKQDDSLLETEVVIHKYEGGKVKLTIELNGIHLVGESHNCFDALVELRIDAEKHSVSIICNGSSLNVYPSGMSKSMGTGVFVYKLSLGKQALRSDLVNIFELGDDYQLCTVEEQKKFFKKWIKSLS